MVIKSLKIPLIYLVLGCLWIYFSDNFILNLSDDYRVLTLLNTFKGWFFVLFTAVLLWFFIWKQLQNLYVTMAKLSERELKEAEERQDKQRMSNELEQKDLQLRQSQKVETMGMLAGGVAHDFNNILGVIQLNIDVLHAQLENKQQVELANEIINACDRGANLTRRLLNFGHKQVFVSQSVNLNTLILDISKMLRRLISTNIVFTNSLTPDLKSVCIDPHQFEQLIVNLVINARDAMPNGGNLSVSTSNVSVQDSLPTATGELSAGNYVLLTIKDSGSGIPDEIKQQIFDPFFTTKQKGQGTGLGLTIVSNIIKQSSGGIVFESQTGKGTIFKIYIPAEGEEKSDYPTGSELKDAGPLHGKERILLAEDNPELRQIIHSSLEEKGYTVQSAGTGRTLLESCSKSKEEFSLLITDVMMPETNITEFIGIIRKKYPAIKVICISGHMDDALKEQGILNRCDHFLSKPFRMKEILFAIRAVLENR